MELDGELDRIAEQQDRSATFELIGKLADPSVGGPERERIGYVLTRLGDPRAVARLTGIGRDRERPAEVRVAALRVLENAGMCPEGAELRAWWNTGDDVVRACVLRQAERGEADLLEPVARDPHHPLHRHALTGIEFRFEEPRWQQYKIQALDHPDPEVRRTAADVLCWDEPVAAEPALRRAAADNDTGVARAAIDTLRYYQSRATLRLLHEIAQGTGERASAAQDSKDDMLVDFESAQLRIRDWVAPVADLLGQPEPETPLPPTPGRPKPSAPPAAEIFAAYSDLDGPWAAKLDALHHYDWTRVPTVDRPGLAAFLSGHPDQEVRTLCCSILSTWQEVDPLLALAHDPELGVRKSAVYYLRFVPPSREIATLTWDLVASGKVASTSGYEALATCAAHTPPGELDDRLIELARTDLREDIRAEAVSQLGDHLDPLLPLLSEPPLVTWGVHIRILNACAKSALHPPAASELRAVDSLPLAAALADLDLAPPC
ncbi:HEAT repeat domain-containing protein [Nocardia sp. NPDC051052]|uniref:HEAT repeat domain-containing protein n=1 Tax=Nocardia sp. NPDC051052 TaxID=3364322 RepID=UPI0037944656